MVDDTIGAKVFRAAYSYLRPYLTSIVVIENSTQRPIVQNSNDELVLEDAHTSKEKWVALRVPSIPKGVAFLYRTWKHHLYPVDGALAKAYTIVQDI